MLCVPTWKLIWGDDKNELCNVFYCEKCERLEKCKKFGRQNADVIKNDLYGPPNNINSHPNA